MVITERTKLRDMPKILPIASLAGVDLMEQCKKFGIASSIRGITPMPFYNLSMNDLAWLWDITDPNDMLTAIAEVFFYPGLPSWKKKLHKNSEQWATKWIRSCPVIDFYRYAYEIVEQIKSAAETFSKMQVNLTEDERAAGYGQPDNESVQKMIDAFARRQHISSLEIAAKYPWVNYRFVFQCDVDEQNRQRRYNEIVAKKNKKK